jgi:hypothetical protein
MVLVHTVVVEVWSPPVLGLSEDDLLDITVDGFHGFPGREDSFKVMDEGGIDVFGEFDSKLDIEVSGFVVAE